MPTMEAIASPHQRNPLWDISYKKLASYGLRGRSIDSALFLLLLGNDVNETCGANFIVRIKLEESKPNRIEDVQSMVRI